MSRRTRVSRASRFLTSSAALLGAAVLAVAATSSPGAARPAGTAVPPLSGAATAYDVLVADGGSLSVAERAVGASGGTVTRVNRAVGLIGATAPVHGFVERLGRVAAIDTVAPSLSFAHAAAVAGRSRARAQGAAGARGLSRLESPRAAVVAARATSRSAATATTDPLDGQLWGMQDIHAAQAHAVQPGKREVRVGLISVGIDGTHPDLSPNFDASLSRNFVTDIPTDPNGNELDGPCEHPSCVDPVDEDDTGGGTLSAGIIGAALNGLGVSGVAPDVTLISVRAGQDYGLYFLQPTVDALTYSADIGIDVVATDFYVDPWLYNCKSNPADSPAEQTEQRLIIKAMKRAMNYAFNRGVTQVGLIGNEHSDLGAPPPDTISPDYPLGTAHDRDVSDSDCLSLPTEGPHEIAVSAYGPSLAKADYSSYGTQQTTVSGPGGYFRDGLGTPSYRTFANQLLSTYPKRLLELYGEVDPVTGDLTADGVASGDVKDCDADGRCAYYTHFQGTSFSAAHAAGVAALIVSQYGTGSGADFGLSPRTVARTLAYTAQETACPTPRTVSYTDVGRDESYTATCEGTPQFNGFYGYGRIDALAAVTRGPRLPRGSIRGE